MHEASARSLAPAIPDATEVEGLEGAHAVVQDVTAMKPALISGAATLAFAAMVWRRNT